jgi:hypothetical protein
VWLVPRRPSYQGFNISRLPRFFFAGDFVEVGDILLAVGENGTSGLGGGALRGLLARHSGNATEGGTEANGTTAAPPAAAPRARWIFRRLGAPSSLADDADGERDDDTAARATGVAHERRGAARIAVAVVAYNRAELFADVLRSLVGAERAAELATVLLFVEVSNDASHQEIVA